MCSVLILYIFNYLLPSTIAFILHIYPTIYLMCKKKFSSTKAGSFHLSQLLLILQHLGQRSECTGTDSTLVKTPERLVE